MKSQQSCEPSAWSSDYGIALRQFLQQSNPSIPSVTQELGQRALVLGLDTLTLAKFHDTALDAFLKFEVATENRSRLSELAAAFFQEALNPIERSRPAAKKTQEEFDDRQQTLTSRTSDLAHSQQALKLEIEGRLASTALLNQETKESHQLLSDARLLEEQLQTMVREILSTAEKDRKRTSLRLTDDIAQALLGIQGRMNVLKTAVTLNQDYLNKEFAIIHRHVQSSIEIIKLLVQEI
jgi:hypothetical protein